MASSSHHLILEEIGRLEAERDVLNRKIAQLRSTLPREQVSVQTPQGSRAVPMSQAPIAVIRSPEVKPDPKITDHAVIRFLERKYGFGFDELKRELLTETVRLAIQMGAASVKAHGGRFMIRGHTATTFVVDRRKR